MKNSKPSEGQVPRYLDGIQNIRMPELISADTLKFLQNPLFDAATLMPALDAFRDMNAQWLQIAGDLNAKFRSLSPTLEWLQKHEERCSRLEEAGWLPHSASPWHLLDNAELNGGTLNDAVEAYYLDKWPEVKASFESAISSYEIDEEAKATFCEAAAAHGYGLYRCVPRTLFPEIERISRAEIYGGTMEGIAGQKALKEAIGSLCPTDIARDGISGMRLYDIFMDHLYENAWSPEEVASIAAVPVPNRHASLHGYVSYNSVRHSVNALIVADYLFQAMSVIKTYAERNVSAGE